MKGYGVIKYKTLEDEAKTGLYERIVVLIVLYEAETREVRAGGCQWTSQS